MRVPAVASLALAFAVLVPSAAAFTSLPIGSSVHDELTAVAKDAGWGPDAVEALQQAVREPDFEESELDPKVDDPARTDATSAYEHKHHCDRLPGTSDADAFNATVAYIHEQRAAAFAAANASDSPGAMAALGRALHALQDCYSHSNIVDLPEHQTAYEAALLHGGPAPPGLKLTGFEPDADDPEDPEGDPYSHKDYAKDSAGMNDDAKAMVGGDGNESMTKFEAAVMLARMATVAFLQEFTHSLPTEQRESLMQVKADDAGLPEDGFNVPAPALGLAAALLVAGAAWARRRTQ